MIQIFKNKQFAVFFLFLPIIAFGVSHTLFAQDCNSNNWTMKWFSNTASSTWSICPDKINFSITATTSSFFLCCRSLIILQSGNQYDMNLYSSSEFEMLIAFDGFEGCDDVIQGVTITGRINEFPSSFDVFSPFRIYCDDSYIDVDGVSFQRDRLRI